ncbi:ferritin subunit-like [Sitophilus oryzae]|uniref:Ferritin n=1 Tax=Sitophilus oryzae TaxID=7048 RepID=A0A6J2XP25_SITOR|nr:ferritin subunit-like [Sitophilus oryzae]
MSSAIMKIFVLVVASFFVSTSGELQCDHKVPDVPKEWIDMSKTCVDSVRDQVTEELKAAMQYMAMGAHFSRDQINRPGFAKLFFEAASEERGHAIEFIKYLLMRGELTENVSDLIKRNLVPATTTWDNGVAALSDALKLEASVTKKIRNIIEVCEKDEQFNDYHLVDYLTAEFLTEQYKGQRDLAGKLSTLEKMMDRHGVLGEYLFDKELL